MSIKVEESTEWTIWIMGTNGVPAVELRGGRANAGASVFVVSDSDDDGNLSAISAEDLLAAAREVKRLVRKRAKRGDT